MFKQIIRLFVYLFLIQASLLAQPNLRFAELGNFQLENGGVIQNCRLAYQTCGQLNLDKSNAVLFPTWFRGTTEDLLKYVGEGKYIDTTKYFVVLVDAFGNGLSSSPSNSSIQPDTSFPYFSIRDLVRSQHLLLTKFLKINKLHAVVGISMGGMMAFEWAVSYPTFGKKIVPVVGSPRLAPFDLLLWKTESRLIEECLCSKCEDTGLFLKMIGVLMSPPERFNRLTSHEGVDSLIVLWQASAKASFNAHDVLRQLHAMITHDVSAPYEHSLEKAGQKIVADLLVIVSTNDRVVIPDPARAFVQSLRSSLLELDSECGHRAFNCEMAQISDALAQFLDERK